MHASRGKCRALPCSNSKIINKECGLRPEGRRLIPWDNYYIFRIFETHQKIGRTTMHNHIKQFVFCIVRRWVQHIVIAWAFVIAALCTPRHYFNTRNTWNPLFPSHNAGKLFNCVNFIKALLHTQAHAFNTQQKRRATNFSGYIRPLQSLRSMYLNVSV